MLPNKFACSVQEKDLCYQFQFIPTSSLPQRPFVSSINLFTIKIQNKDIKPILKRHNGGNAIKGKCLKTLHPHTIKHTGPDRTIQRHDSAKVLTTNILQSHDHVLLVHVAIKTRQ